MVKGTEINFNRDYSSSCILSAMSCVNKGNDITQMILEMTDRSVYSVEGDDYDIREYETYIKSAEDYIDFAFSGLKIEQLR